MVGIFAFINTTFTMLVSVDEGFQSPIRLVDHLPQSGVVMASRYVYYKYSLDNSSLIGEIKFTLTPSSK